MSKPRALTRPYSLTRMQLSLGYARCYLRTFWWVMVSVPVFGLIALTFAHANVLKVIGLIALLWPLSVPARAYILTSKFARRFLRPTTMLIGEEDLFFAPEGAPGMKIARDRIRSITHEGAMEVLQSHRLGIILVPTEAFLSEDELNEFRALGR